MSVAKQFDQLQELDLELSSNNEALNQITSQVGDNQVMIEAQDEFTSAQQQLEELKNQQHSIEWEIDDLISKLTAFEEKLYNGKISNPKELTGLQHEVDILKAKRDQLEDKALEVMSQVELATVSVATMGSDLERMEIEWQSQQKQLSSDMEQLKTVLSDLGHKRQLLVAKIDPKAVELYHKLKQQKGTAVANVEQGVCRGCRISLSAAELQRARGGSLVQCNSCGRILFLA
ncbi:zinc ribbon domain-containing protein [Chloroflexota bacterium]